MSLRLRGIRNVAVTAVIAVRKFDAALKIWLSLGFGTVYIQHSMWLFRVRICFRAAYQFNVVMMLLEKLRTQYCATVADKADVDALTQKLMFYSAHEAMFAS